MTMSSDPQTGAGAPGTGTPHEAPAPVRLQAAVPIHRIFDVAKAREFYMDFLGFSLDWEHRYGDDFPLYMQVSRGDVRLHLSEHFGDATPGSTTCVPMTGIRTLHAELAARDYRHMRPDVVDVGGRLELSVTDPFGNRIRFLEVVASD